MQVTQVQGICWSGLVGDLRNWNAGLSEMKVGFLELVDRMGDPRKPYGEMARLWGSAVAYGRMAGLWGSVKTYGETAIPYGEMACVGGRRIAWGSRENVWEMPRDMGTCAGTWGSRQAICGAKITLKPGIWERGRPADFADFNEFLVGTAVLSGRPLKCMRIIKNMVMHEPLDATCGLCVFS